MNQRQRVVLAVGGLMFAIAVAFPAWTETFSIQGAPRTDRAVGRAFLLTPPTPRGETAHYGMRVDGLGTSLGCAAAVALTLVAYLLAGIIPAQRSQQPATSDGSTAGAAPVGDAPRIRSTHGSADKRIAYGVWSVALISASICLAAGQSSNSGMESVGNAVGFLLGSLIPGVLVWLVVQAFGRRLELWEIFALATLALGAVAFTRWYQNERELEDRRLFDALEPQATIPAKSGLQEQLAELIAKSGGAATPPATGQSVLDAFREAKKQHPVAAVNTTREASADSMRPRSELAPQSVKEQLRAPGSTLPDDTPLASTARAERVMELSSQRWRCVWDTERIEAFEVLTPEQKRALNLQSILEGEDLRCYANKRPVEVLKVDAREAFVRATARWTPQYSTMADSKRAPGQSRSQDVELIETWWWVAGDWSYIRTQRPSDFFGEHPELKKTGETSGSPDVGENGVHSK